MKLTNKKIIIIEDEDKINIYLLKALLSKLNAEVTFCGTADEFYKKYDDSYDIIILDLRIPGNKYGKEFLKELKSKISKPVIVQVHSEEEEKECKELGAEEVILKPAIIAEKIILSAIEKII
jgi:CheY-like chemotaxis protein